ncbi:MAG: phytanoyl-CoA dioxygenase family protein [Gammaproteobacteria bacterium]
MSRILMPKRLTKQQVEEFYTCGFLTALDVFSASECDAVRARSERFEQTNPADVEWAFDIKANLLFDWVYELGIHPVLLDIVEDLVGPDVLLTNSIFRIKEPGSATHYGWHQDAARIQVDPPFVIAYLAIGETTAENGCLRVIPNTHYEVQPYRFVTYSRRRLARVKEVDESSAVDLVLAKGQMGVFHGNTIHGSGPNTSRTRRFALINDYTPTRARQSTGQGSGQLVRGEDRWGHFAREPVPVGSFTEANILARRKTLCRYPENVLMGPLEPGEEISFADQPGAAPLGSSPYFSPRGEIIAQRFEFTRHFLIERNTSCISE